MNSCNSGHHQKNVTEKAIDADRIDKILSMAQATPRPLPPNGVIIGTLAGFSENNRPLLTLPSGWSNDPVEGKTTVNFTSDDIGRKVAVLPEGGDPLKPVVIGLIIEDPVAQAPQDSNTGNVQVDGERITYTAQKEIVLQCGKSSITLTKAGKILIKGEYVSSHSKGVNRIRGGSIQLN